MLNRSVLIRRSDLLRLWKRSVAGAATTERISAEGSSLPLPLAHAQQLRSAGSMCPSVLTASSANPVRVERPAVKTHEVTCPQERRQREELEAKPRPDPASMTSVLDIVSAIVDLKADYERAMQKAQQIREKQAAVSGETVTDTSGSQEIIRRANTMTAHRRLIKRVDQRYLAHCVERLNELCELAVSRPEDSLLAVDLASTELLEALLEALHEAVRFNTRHAFPDDFHQSPKRVGKRVFSPWLPSTTCEFIGMWMGLRWTPEHLRAQTQGQLRKYLFLCTDLFVGDVDSVQFISTRISAKGSVQRSTMPVNDAIDSLNLVTLAIKRLHIRPPDLAHLLSTVSFAKKMTSYQSLQVLSSLCRVHEQRNLEIILVITRRETPNVARYSLADCMFSLRVCMTLTGVSEPFVVEVLRALTPQCAKMTPREVATTCHLLTMMRNSRRHSHLIRNVCSRETRRLMPALLAQTKVHLKRFSPKDANYVLDCFLAFNVQHPYIFSQLAMGVSE